MSHLFTVGMFQTTNIGRAELWSALACGSWKVTGPVTFLARPIDVLQMCDMAQKMREVRERCFPQELKQSPGTLFTYLGSQARH